LPSTSKEAPVFEEFAGLPAHPLLLHAAVVLVPLLALGAVAYALLPFLRPHIRLVVGLLALAAPGAAYLAKLSGDAFLSRMIARNLISPEIQQKIHEHRDFGNLTVYSVAALGLITLVLVAVVAPRPRLAARGRVPAGVRSGTAGQFDGPDAADAAGADQRTAAVRPARGAPTVVTVLLAALTVAAALVTAYYVFRTGDSGARAVWSGF
jgi:hypothetical protein